MNDGHVGVVFSQGNAHWAARSIGTFQVSPGLSVEPGLSQPRASALEDKLNQLSRAHNPRGLPDVGEMPPISCDQKIGACCFGAFQKAVIRFVRRYGEGRRWRDHSAHLPDADQGFGNSFGWKSKPWPAQDTFVFDENRRRD